VIESGAAGGSADALALTIAGWLLIVARRVVL
jgi:hypothetical protein